MDIYILIPFLLGLISAFIINYLSDILPFTFRLGRPICHQEGCGKKYSWGPYIFLGSCTNCGYRARLRPIILYLIVSAIALLLWLYPLGKLDFLMNFVVITFLVLVALIDLEHHLILLPLNISGLLILGGAGFLLHGWSDTLFGGIAGAFVMFILFLLGKLFTRFRAIRLNTSTDSLDDSLAFGDVILFSLLGLFLGWINVWFGLLLGLLLAGLISLIVLLILFINRKYKKHVLSVFIPLGPAFIIATILLTYFPGWILSIIT